MNTDFLRKLTDTFPRYQTDFYIMLKDPLIFTLNKMIFKNGTDKGIKLAVIFKAESAFNITKSRFVGRIDFWMNV